MTSTGNAGALSTINSSDGSTRPCNSTGNLANIKDVTEALGIDGVVSKSEGISGLADRVRKLLGEPDSTQGPRVARFETRPYAINSASHLYREAAR